jgi:hypothetical protein
VLDQFTTPAAAVRQRSCQSESGADGAKLQAVGDCIECRLQCLGILARPRWGVPVSSVTLTQHTEIRQRRMPKIRASLAKGSRYSGISDTPG